MPGSTHCVRPQEGVCSVHSFAACVPVSCSLPVPAVSSDFKEKVRLKKHKMSSLNRRAAFSLRRGHYTTCPGRTQPSSDTKPAQQRSNTLLSPVGFCSPRQLQMLSESGLWTFGWHRLRTCRRTRMLWNGKGIQRDF